MLDLEDDQRALVWVDRRFARILPPGQYVYWTNHREVRVEVIDARRARFEHDDLKVIVRNPTARDQLEIGAVGRGCVGVLFLDGASPARSTRARGPSGRARPTSASSRSTSARRRSTCRARRS